MLEKIKEVLRNKIKPCVIKNKVHVIYGIVIFILLVVMVLVFQHKLVTKVENPPVTEITDTTPASVATGQAAVGKYTGADDAKDVSNLITKAVQSGPTAVFYTTTQKAADNEAQTLAKADKADYVLKQTTSTPVKSAEQIQNNYYAIQQERKHRMAAGVTAIDGQAYATVSYTNDRLTYELHSKDMKGIDGASIMYTVKKW